MSKSTKSLVSLIPIIVAAGLIAGCSSPSTPNEAPPVTEGIVFNEIKVTVFQPPT